MTALVPRAARTAPVRPAGMGLAQSRRSGSPAFWTLVALLLAGGWSIGRSVYGALLAYPRGTCLAIALFGLYAVPFLLFISNVDYLEREPATLLATAFGWGVVVTAVAAPGNLALDAILGKLTSPAFAAAWGPALVAPTIEEPLKVLGVVMITLVARSQINSVVDGFVYGAVAGLGFQVMENIGYAVTAVATDGPGDHIDQVLATFVLRGFVAGLWSHTMFTALAGAGVAYVVVRRPHRSGPARLTIATLCLAGAWLGHFIWNSPMVTDGLGALAEVIVKGAPVLALVLWLARSASALEADYYARILAGLADPRIASDAELAALSTARGRVAAVRAARQRAGRPGERAARALHQAQAKLAVEISRHGPAGLPEAPGSLAPSPVALGSLAPSPVAPGSLAPSPVAPSRLAPSAPARGPVPPVGAAYARVVAARQRLIGAGLADRQPARIRRRFRWSRG